MTTKINAVQMDLVIDLLEVLNGDDDAAAAHQLRRPDDACCAAPAPGKAELIGMNSKERSALGFSVSMDRNARHVCSIGTCAIAATGACLVVVASALYFRAALPS